MTKMMKWTGTPTGPTPTWGGGEGSRDHMALFIKL